MHKCKCKFQNQLAWTTQPIGFKENMYKLRLRHGRFAIYMPEFARAKTERVSREETELLVCKQIGILILINAMTIHYDM